VDLLVLVAGMVPRPGEPPDDWWANTGYQQARRERDERAGGPPADDIALFLHDVPPDLAAEALRRETGPVPPWTSPGPCRHGRRCPPGSWSAATTASSPPGSSTGWCGDRLGITADEMDGSHCVALSHPKDLADRLEAYRAELRGTAGQEPTEAT
jgi:hypothetical protein